MEGHPLGRWRSGTGEMEERPWGDGGAASGDGEAREWGAVLVEGASETEARGRSGNERTSQGSVCLSRSLSCQLESRKPPPSLEIKSWIIDAATFSLGPIHALKLQGSQ